MRSPTKPVTLVINLAQTHDLSEPKIAALTCPGSLKQAFLRDMKAPGLSVRVTANGAKSFVFEKKFNGKTIRRTIGRVGSWSIEKARAEARHLAVMLDKNQDPREIERQEAAKRAAIEVQAATTKAFEAMRETTVREAWDRYSAVKTLDWAPITRVNYIKMTAPSRPCVGRKGETAPGILNPLLALRLCDLTAERVEKWAIEETAVRPTAARVAWGAMSGLLEWCNERDDLSALLPQNRESPYKSKRVLNSFKKPSAKTDTLLREQLTIWFKTVQELKNPVIAAYLQTILLTGARPDEIRNLRWDDINIEWRLIKISSGKYDERDIPLTPYVSQLIHALPRRNSWVFSSRAVRRKNINISPPRENHRLVCKAAKIDHVTLHGLRRTFGSLSEWFELPKGVVAQLQGHSPNSTIEKHYRVRPVDLLRMYAELIETTFLKWASVTFDSKTSSNQFQRVSLISDRQGVLEDVPEL